MQMVLAGSRQFLFFGCKSTLKVPTKESETDEIKSMDRREWMLNRTPKFHVLFYWNSISE